MAMRLIVAMCLVLEVRPLQQKVFRLSRIKEYIVEVCVFTESAIFVWHYNIGFEVGTSIFNQHLVEILFRIHAHSRRHPRVVDAILDVADSSAKSTHHMDMVGVTHSLMRIVY